MDENETGRRWLSFGIRDLLWAMVVVGMALQWWREHRSSHVQLGKLRRELSAREYDKHNLEHLKWKTTELERQVRGLATYAKGEQERADKYWKQLKDCQAEIGKHADAE